MNEIEQLPWRVDPHLARALALTTNYALDATRRDTITSIAVAFERGLIDQLQARRLRKQVSSSGLRS